jgi:hypothetical protein
LLELPELSVHLGDENVAKQPASHMNDKTSNTTNLYAAGRHHALKVTHESAVKE